VRHRRDANELPEIPRDELRSVVGYDRGFCFWLDGPTACALEGGSTLLEELFLPTVEHCWLQRRFLTGSAPALIQPVPSPDGYLFFGRLMLSFLWQAPSPLS
jgi:hypothetical protein